MIDVPSIRGDVAVAASADGPRLRPRVIDVSGSRYEHVATLLDHEEGAYFERRGARTMLVVP